MDNPEKKPSETVKAMLQSIIESTEEGEAAKKVLTQKEKLMKLMMMIRLTSMVNIVKEDNQPIELIQSLFIGSFASALNKKALKENSITHIVVAGTGLKQNYPGDFEYIQFNLLDAESEDIKQYFNDAGEFIDSALAKGGKVLVHWYDSYLIDCVSHAGISRSSTIVLSYLIRYRKMQLDDALKLIRAKREKINPNPGFIKQLREYEENCLSNPIDKN